MKNIFFVFLLISFSQAIDVKTDSTIQVYIRIEPSNQQIEIKLISKILSNLKKTVTYDMIVEKINASGKNRIRQSGTVDLEPGKEILMSKVKVNSLPKGCGNYRIHAKIYHNGVLIQKIEKFYPDTNLENNK